MNLSEILAGLASDAAGGFSLEAPEDWGQGRTLYGGLNAALLVEAARRGVGELGPLRAVQIAFMAPAAGHVRYVPAVLRRGRSIVFVGVDAWADDVLCVRSILTYGAARESELAFERLSAPAVPAPENCPPVRVPEGGPVFLQHLELGFAGGTPPFSGGEPDFSMWVRHREAAGLDPLVALLAIADVLPPAVSALSTSPRPGSSVTWTLELATLPADPGGWYLMRTTGERAAEGYSAQAMSCFSTDGRLAAVSRQTVATF